MNLTRLFILHLIMFGMCSCHNSKTEADYIYSEYVNSSSVESHTQHPDTLTFKKGYGVRLFYDKNDNLLRLGGRVLGGYYGNFFKFNNGPKFTRSLNLGKVIQYTYEKEIGSNGHKYGLEYNFKSNAYHEDGSQYVDFFSYLKDNDSAIRYTFHFSTFPRSNVKALYSLKNGEFTELKIHKSDFMPFLDEAVLTMKRGVKEIVIRTEAKELRFDYPNLPDKKTFIDTVPLILSFEIVGKS